MVLMTAAVGQSCLVVRITSFWFQDCIVLEENSGDAFCISNNGFKMNFSKAQNCSYLGEVHAEYPSPENVHKGLYRCTFLRPSVHVF